LFITADLYKQKGATYRDDVLMESAKSKVISGLLNDLTRVKKKRQFFVCVQSSSSFTIHGLLRVI
jgi:hypothetical protein